MYVVRKILKFKLYFCERTVSTWFIIHETNAMLGVCSSLQTHNNMWYFSILYPRFKLVKRPKNKCYVNENLKNTFIWDGCVIFVIHIWAELIYTRSQTRSLVIYISYLHALLSCIVWSFYLFSKRENNRKKERVK